MLGIVYDVYVYNKIFFINFKWKQKHGVRERYLWYCGKVLLPKGHIYVQSTSLNENLSRNEIHVASSFCI